MKYKGRDDADLINLLSSVDEAQVAVLFNEQSGEQVKISWRSKPDFDVSKIAQKFGGGGHPSAAGAEISGSLENVVKDVLKETKISLENLLETPS